MPIFTKTTDVTIENPENIVYIRGDETTDNSIRLVIGANDQTQLQRRKNGVWNTTSLELDKNSLLLGPSVSIGSQGTSIKISSVDGNRESIILDIPISDSGTQEPRTIRAMPRVNRVIAQPIFNVETVTQTSLFPIITAFQGYIFTAHFKIGSVAASESLTFTVTGGLVPGGPIFFQKEFPANDFPENTEIKLSGLIDLGVFVGDEVLLTVTSDADFSFLGDIFQTPWLAVDIQEYIFEEVISTPTGTDKYLIDSSGDIISDNVGNLVLNASNIN